MNNYFEECESCEKTIYNFESPYVYMDCVLCEECYKEAKTNHVLFVQKICYSIFPTVLYDLCLPPTIQFDFITLTRCNDKLGYYEPSNNTIYINSIVETKKMEYIYMIARETRLAWQLYNSIPLNRKDCDEYASYYINKYGDKKIIGHMQKKYIHQLRLEKYFQTEEQKGNDIKYILFMLGLLIFSFASIGLLIWTINE